MNKLTEKALTLLKGAAFKRRSTRFGHAVARHRTRKFPYT